MPLSFSDYLGIEPTFLEDRGAFDLILDCDSGFFINFQRVKSATTPEFQTSGDRIRENLRKVGILLSHSKHRGDRFYREAYNLLDMSELEEICLGYSKTGTSGSGSGHNIKTTILNTGKEIIDAGITDPEIFEIVGLFEEGIGPDRISDAIGRIIKVDIINFNKRIVKELSESVDLKPYRVNNGLLVNPFSQKPIFLLPKEVLHELPVAQQWEDIDYVCSIIRQMRNEMNVMIGDEWKELNLRQKKNALKRILLNDTELFAEVLNQYKELSLPEYDFEKDQLGESLWYPLSKEVIRESPLYLKIQKIDTQELLLSTIRDICLHFKELVENNGLNKVFFTDDLKPRKEWVIQRTFQAIATSICNFNNIDMSPEVNSGRGPVDFKFSIGNFKVLVEVKLTSNPKLISGYQKQLVEYKNSERTEDAYYLVIENGSSGNQLGKLFEVHNEFVAQNIKMHELIVIDSKIKPSASNM